MVGKGMAEKRINDGAAGKLREAMLYNKIDAEGGKKVHCRLCSHYCLIGQNGAGKCLVRQNINGRLCSLSWGRAAGFAIDPIEKKPFFHLKPGSKLLSFGTPGCNFRCLNCQNWDLSQAVRDGGKGALDIPITTPKEIAKIARLEKVDGIAYTYSEPTIFYEYAFDTVMECREAGLDLFNVFVSNGYFTKEMLEDVARHDLLQGIRIDLKFINDEKYMEVCGGHLQIVKDNIKRVHALRGKVALEVIALIIPTMNDGEEDVRGLCKFIAGVGRDIPLHFSRFYPQYKMEGLPPTPEGTLLRCREIAREEGLHHIYIGNTGMPDVENTHCPKCNHLLIKRSGFFIEKNEFEGLSAKEREKPKCPRCGYHINIRL